MNRRIVLATALIWLACELGADALKLSSTSNADKICRHAAAWTLVPHERSCHKFYVCAGYGRYEEFTCGEDYYYNSEHSRCVLGTCKEPKPLVQLQPAACAVNSVQRMAEDCSRYWHCTPHGTFTLASCASGNYFDASTRVCLPVAVTARHQCSCLLPEHTTLPNPDDCETFFQCQHGEAVLKQCPRNEYYDVELSSCLLDTTGVCLEPPTMPPTSLLDSATLALHECASTGGRLAPHSNDCSQFYVCAKSEALRMSCPIGHYFDAVQHHCRHDAGRKCSKVPQTEQDNESLPTVSQVEYEMPLQEQLKWPVLPANVAKQPSLDHGVVQSSHDKLLSKFIPF